MLLLYNILLFLGITLGLPVIIPVVLTSRKRRKTVLQRLGLRSFPESLKQGKLHSSGEKPIWVHALSVGEVISAVPLVKALKERFEDKHIVFSVSTKTGFEIAGNLLKENVDGIFFYPYDLTISVKYIANKIDPACVIIVETDIWPNFLFEMKRHRVPVILVNARLSDKSFSGYKRLAVVTRAVFSAFSKICAQSGEDARRFGLLGVPLSKIEITGNFKFDQVYDPVSVVELEKIKGLLHFLPQEKIFLAGSTHKGEELILGDAFSMIKKAFNHYRFIVVPRDPKRAGAVSRIFRSAGFSSALLKDLEGEAPGKSFDVIVVDVIGILTKLYALADIAFVGGSLVSCGGHNPLEPAAFSKPVIFGPDMGDFLEISRMLIESGGAVRVEDANGIYEASAMLISDSQKIQTMGKCAFDVFHANKGAVDRTLKVVSSFFPL